MLKRVRNTKSGLIGIQDIVFERCLHTAYSVFLFLGVSYGARCARLWQHIWQQIGEISNHLFLCLGHVQRVNMGVCVGGRVEVAMTHQVLLRHSVNTGAAEEH